MIATCNVNSEKKMKWLKWWNSSTQTWEARRFPLNPVGENELKLFLAKACWYSEVCLSRFTKVGVSFSLCFVLTMNINPRSKVFLIVLFLALRLQIEEMGSEMLDEIVKKDQLVLAMNSLQEPESFPDYIEGWRICV